VHRKGLTHRLYNPLPSAAWQRIIVLRETGDETGSGRMVGHGQRQATPLWHHSGAFCGV